MGAPPPAATQRRSRNTFAPSSKGAKIARETATGTPSWHLGPLARTRPRSKAKLYQHSALRACKWPVSGTPSSECRYNLAPRQRPRSGAAAIRFAPSPQGAKMLRQVAARSPLLATWLLGANTLKKNGSHPVPFLLPLPSGRGAGGGGSPASGNVRGLPGRAPSLPCPKPQGLGRTWPLAEAARLRPRRPTPGPSRKGNGAGEHARR